MILTRATHKFNFKHHVTQSLDVDQHSVKLKETVQQPKSNLEHCKYLLKLSKNFKGISMYILNTQQTSLKPPLSLLLSISQVYPFSKTLSLLHSLLASKP